MATEPDKLHLPVTALGLKKHSWVLCGDALLHNGIKVMGPYGCNLDLLGPGQTVAVSVDTKDRLR